MSAMRLEVMIAAFGEDGMRRIVNAAHPRLEDVRYTVCWQMPGGKGVVPQEIAARPDFTVYISDTTGSGTNRDHCMKVCSGDLILLSDDDLSYTEEGLRGVIDAFDRYPDCDVLTFRYDSDCLAKKYSDEGFPLDRPRRRFYITCFEIAFRREAAAGIGFNHHFGVNCDFCAGEEDLFLNDLLRHGLKGRYVPHTVCFHPGTTTGTRGDPALLVEAKGAIFTRLHPRTWPLRMVIHAFRHGRPIWYCRRWMAGVVRARRLHVFRD